MHPHRRFKHSHRSPEAQAVQSAIWMIGLGILFLTGWWWPGIMIVIGISMVAGALAREMDVWGSDPGRETPRPQPAPQPKPASPPSPWPEPPQLRVEVKPAPAPIRLPDICPRCGAPTRSLRSHSDNPAECPYCGSNIAVGPPAPRGAGG